MFLIKHADNKHLNNNTLCGNIWSIYHSCIIKIIAQLVFLPNTFDYNKYYYIQQIGNTCSKGVTRLYDSSFNYAAKRWMQITNSIRLQQHIFLKAKMYRNIKMCFNTKYISFQFLKIFVANVWSEKENMANFLYRIVLMVKAIYPY